MCTSAPTLLITVPWPLWNPWWPVSTSDRDDKKPCLHLHTASRPFLDSDVPIKVPLRIKGWKVSQEESHKAEIKELISLSEMDTQSKLCGSGMLSLGYCGLIEQGLGSTASQQRAQGINACQNTPRWLSRTQKVVRKADKEKSVAPLQNFHLNMFWVFPPPSENSAFDFVILKVQQ